ncbi:DUF5405 family protein, partial [Salmonella enterica subsp. enterica serovar Lubbock]|nr:DUF5405 family protein [Salmonella enterica subsp. enterica serovar Lubbock]
NHSGTTEWVVGPSFNIAVDSLKLWFGAGAFFPVMQEAKSPTKNIAIYQNELNLLSDVVNLLVKRAVFHKQISSVDELTKLTTEIA